MNLKENNSIPLSLHYLIMVLFLSLCFLGSSITNATTRSQVNTFFENLKTLEADFIQVGPSGNISDGKIYFDLPGKLRIDYNKPNNLLITCKGSWIVLQDRNLKTTNNIPLKNSPFSIFLEKKMSLSNKNIKTEIQNRSGIISFTIKSSNNNEAGELTLEFSEKPLHLKKWIIKNAFGDITTVLVQNAKYNKKLSHLLFFPDDFPEPIH